MIRYTNFSTVSASMKTISPDDQNTRFYVPEHLCIPKPARFVHMTAPS
jgi:hypothetical protein